MSLDVNLSELRNTVDHLLTNAGPQVNSSLSILRGMINHELNVFQRHVNGALLSTVQANKFMLAALADSWIALGAKAYVINDPILLFCWPEAYREEFEQSEPQVLWSALRVEGRRVGRVGVVGLSDEGMRHRLEAEAALLSLVLSLKTDLEHLRTDLLAQEQMKNEMDLAANIQLQLLQQKIPKVPGIDLYARSMPARQIGGDFYNFNLHKQGSLVFAVGDVSGKGLPAAMLMAMTRIVLHGAARFMPKVNPRLLLSRINEDLYDDFTELGMFATTFVGCYDPNAQQLTYANAGHSPVIFCPRGGPAVLLEADGPAVGVLPINLCENESRSFLPGDLLVVATDGFSEAANAQGEMFGYERLLRLVEHSAARSAEAIATELFRAIIHFASGEAQNDDQTLIVLKGVDV